MSVTVQSTLGRDLNIESSRKSFKRILLSSFLCLLCLSYALHILIM